MATFEWKLLILNRIIALRRFAEPFQNLSNHFKCKSHFWRGSDVPECHPPSRHFDDGRRDVQLVSGAVAVMRTFAPGFDVRARRGDGIPIFAAHLDFSSAELRAALAAEQPGALFQIKVRRRRALSRA